jgi:poly(3-hydroxybutyrate) depolymerase
MAPVPPGIPAAADGCITDVSPGDHAYSCDGLTYLVVVDPKCVSGSCGLIFDVHADLMSATQMRDSTLLHQSAPALGYLVVHPSPTAATIAGTWDDAQHYPRVLEFMMRIQRAFHVDPQRIHVTGFGHGADMAQWFMCHHSALVASAAALSNTRPAADCFVASWQPRVPYLYMHGTLDAVTPIAEARAMQTALVAQLHLVGEAPIEGDALYTRQRWRDSAGMELEWIEHQYMRATLGGYCIPGGNDALGGINGFTATTCQTAGTLRWGDLVLQWFQAHPRRA